MTLLVQSLKNYPFWPFLSQYRRPYTLGLLSLVLVDAINVGLPLVVKFGVDSVEMGLVARVWWAGGLYFALMLVQAWGRYLWRIYLIGTSHTVAAELRRRLYSHLQKLPLCYYQKVRTGDLMSRATNDVESVRQAVGPGVLVTADAIVMFALIVPVMFALSWKLSCLAFFFFPLVPWLTLTVGDKIDVLYESLQRRMSGLGAFAQEVFSGIRLIKSLVLEGRSYEQFVGLSELYRQEGVQLARYQALFSPALGLLTNLGTFLILLIGGWEVLSGTLGLGTFIAFQRFVVQLSWPMEAIGWTVTMHREGAAAYRRLLEIFSVSQISAVRVDAARPRPSEHLVEVTGLRYALGNSFALELDGLWINKGEKIGLVGGVGSGKSTFFHLLLRLYEPPTGSLWLKGKDVTSIDTRELRRWVASVEQPVFLFSESVASNVDLGRGRKASLDELERLGEVASFLGEIRAFERGFETVLGERGIDLSGGQKQRLALMRALARGPELLCLDDSFSALDVAVEKQILTRFLEEYPHLTVLIASHRLSVMPLLDRIWVLDRGRLIATGTHQALLDREPLYRRLWRRSERELEAKSLGLNPYSESVL